jgi:hypothetical protein
MRGRYEDLTGRRFGKLTVKSLADKDESGTIRWNCVCDCGEAITSCMSSLTREQLRILARAEAILDSVWVDLTLAETDEEWNEIRDESIRQLVELGEPEVFEAYRQQWDEAAAIIVPLVREAQISNGIEPYTPEQYERRSTAGTEG